MKRKSILELEPDGYEAMLALERYGQNCAISPKLKELIKIRASQINGCAYCIDMHTEDALKLGENPRRIFALSAWHESHLFTDEERALLQLTEEVTKIAEKGISDETFTQATKIFGEKATAQIIMLGVIINAWNRIALAGKAIFKP